jgi:hypothetical protein
MPYLIDSDILIDISRGKQAAREYVDALTEGCRPRMRGRRYKRR